MKLTKKQRLELYDSHSGVGTLFLNLGNNTIITIDIWLGKNGTFYTQQGPMKNTPFNIFLDEIKKEITDDD